MFLSHGTGTVGTLADGAASGLRCCVQAVPLVTPASARSTVRSGAVLRHHVDTQAETCLCLFQHSSIEQLGHINPK